MLMLLGGLLRPFLQTGVKIDNLSAAINAGSGRRAMSQISVALLVFGQSRILQLMVRSPVVGMRPRVSHSDYHGFNLPPHLLFIKSLYLLDI